MDGRTNTRGQRWSVKHLQDNSQSLLGFPKEIMKHIISHLNDYDAIMARASCKSLFNLIDELHPFPKHFILDQSDCAKYFIHLGSVSCLEYCKNALNFFFMDNDAFTAVILNNLSLLKYLHENGCHINHSVFMLAAMGVNLDIMKYCHENTSASIKKEYGGSSCNLAGRDLQVLKYLIDHGYKWDSNLGLLNVDCAKYLIDKGFNGEVKTISSLEIMKFLDKHGFEWKTDACSSAIKAKNLDMLKYAHEHGSDWNDAVHLAIRSGELECLKYMIENGATVVQPVTAVGSLDVLKYLREHTNAVFLPELYSTSVENMQKGVLEYLPHIIGLARPHSLGTSAAQSGNLEFLKWCIEDQLYDTNIKIFNQVDSMDILAAALLSKSLEVVKYVIEKNLGPRTMTIAEYIENGAVHRWTTVDIWEYLYNIQQFNITDYMMRSPIQTGSIEILEWMEQHGATFTEKHIDIAIQSKALKSVAYFLKKGITYSVGCLQGNALCYKYAIEHGCPWSPSAITLLGDDVDLLRYMVHCGHVTLGPELYHNAKRQDHEKILAYLEAKEVKPTVQSTIKSTIQSIVGLFTRK